MTATASLTGLEIAVIGMAGRFPRAQSVDELWQRVERGIECLSSFSDAELRTAGIDRALLEDTNYVRAGGVVDGVEMFDAGFFGYSPREAALLDPQHRFFLETAWTALEHAGYAPGSFHAAVGVYGGVGLNDYFLKNVLPAKLDAPADMLHLANDRDFLTTRVSYKLNLAGPSLVVQTACSTSLVAIHTACQALIAGECDMALAGGVTIRLPQASGYLFQEGGIASPDGHCRPFAATAQGSVPGNGGAIVVLKRLSEAMADGDCIHAVIKGSAINNDGAAKVGYTAPSVDGQVRVIRSALQVAGVSADTIGYLEAHGTGTVLGDPIEIQAATQAFRQDTSRTGYCGVGSIKSNIGHLDAGAGVAGFIKAVLAVKHGVLPPTLHCDVTNPTIDFHHSPFYVCTSRRDWPNGSTPRRAAVSAFGIGGTNAHVILEQPPAAARASRASTPELLIVSAKTERALDESCASLAAHLRSNPDADLADVAFTLKTGRAAMPCRRAVVARTCDEAGDVLRTSPVSRAVSDDQAQLVFMFPGQGSQYPGMGRHLYDTEPLLRRHVDAATELVIRHTGVDLRRFVTGDFSDGTEQLRDTTIAQPAIFTVSYALAQLVDSWGLKPAAMIGHSIGEYVAACLAGVFSFEDALGLVCERGRLMASVPPGSMVAVAMGVEDLAGILPPALSIAAVNAPHLTVVAGPQDDADHFARILAGRGVEVRTLHTSRAFHSAAMDPVLDAFIARFRDIRLEAPKLRYVSNVTGTWIAPQQATDPAYWARHLRHTVRFSEGLQKLIEMQGSVFLEIGPGQTLTSLARRHARDGHHGVAAFATTRRPEERDDAGVVLEALGGLWRHGVDVDWRRVDKRPGRRLPLPTYPFQRERCWIDANPAQTLSAGARLDQSEWYSVPSWQRVADAGAFAADTISSALWLVFLDEYGFAADIAARIEAAHGDLVTVSPGDRFSRLSSRAYQVACRPADYRELCAALQSHGRDEVRVVHCWSIEPDALVRRGRAVSDAYQERGFYSLLFLTQALGDQSWLNASHISVVSTNVQEVLGTETLCPEKATVVGAVKVIPLEYSGITCRHVDVVLPESGSREWHALVDDVCVTLSERGDSSIAIRGRHRWRWTAETVQLPRSDRPPLLKERGVYLITGGLGGVGLEVAEYLFRTVHARLVLAGRDTSLAAGPTDPVVDVGRALYALDAHAERIADSVALAPMSSMPGLEQTLDRLCAVYARSFLEAVGVDVTRPQLVERRALLARGRVLSRFERLFDAILRALEQSGTLEADAVNVRFTGEIDASSADELLRDASARYPTLTPVFELLARCAGQFPQALAGDIPAIGLLFGAENVGLLKQAVETIRAHSYVPVCEALVRELLTGAAGLSDRPLRILEVGGGDGLLTDALLTALEGHQVEYTFTDVSRTFVVNAERRAREQHRRGMRFGVLDISSSAAAQGYAPEHFDVVVAFNVVHATRSIAATLGHLRELVAPGGLIVLQESVRSARWVDFIWGLTDGWWAFEDSTLRRLSPLLDAESWVSSLRGAGFERLAAYPGGSLARSADTAVIVGCKPVEATRPATVSEDRRLALTQRQTALGRLKDAGAEMLVLAADVADPVAMHAAVDAALQRFGTVDGVIHAALVLNDGAIAKKTRAAVETAFKPKLTGTLVLKEVCERLDLDFFVMFSSLVSIVGGAGQVDYCAASNFQDVFAHAEHGRLARVVMAIDWGAWRDVGKAFRSAVERGASPQTAVPTGMTPAEGVDAFARVLASAMPHVLVSPQHLSYSRAGRDRVIASMPAAPPSAPPLQNASMPAASRSAPRTETERVIASIWQEILGVPDLGVQDNFFDLGGDSMISLQFIAKAKKAGLRFTNRQVFEHQTIAELAAIAAERH